MNIRDRWDDYRVNRILSFIWFLIITFLTLSPDVNSLNIPSIVAWQDKLEHMIVFWILAIFICRSFSPATKYSPMNRILIAMLIVTFYGALDEIVQGFIPNRSADIWDLVFDILGAFFGGISFLFVPFLNNIE